MPSSRLFSALLGAATLILGAPLSAQGPGGILPTPQDTPNRQGTRGANFLHIGIGARGGAMAGSVGATVSGPTSWYWNPAGAATSEGFEVVAGRQNLYGDLGLGQTYSAVSIPLIGGVVGVSLNTLSSGDMLRTTEANPFGERLGGTQFQWTSTALTAGYAKRLTDRLSVGGQMKYINEGITDVSTSWVAFDVGTQFNTGLYGLVLGGAIQNVGGQSSANGALITRFISTADGSQLRENRRVQFFTRETEIPVAFRLSIGSDLLGTSNSLFGGAGGNHLLNAELSVADATDFATQYGVGAEYAFKNTVFVRGGKRFYNDDRWIGASATTYGLAGGFGLRVPLKGRSIKFDYSFQNAGALQNIQIFSFEVRR
ncbi:MAG: PorV/PorQ family protein [Gemmatimonadaceae bacterium]